MKVNPVKRALAEGRPQFGTWLSLGDVATARLMARSGFSWLTVDLEHSPIDWSVAALMFATIADSGCVPLARVPRGDHDLIKRCLDGGAMGIVVPMVNTADEARTAIAAARYPPTGNRSIGGSLGALNFQAAAGEYYERANDEILVVLQTESPIGVDNAPEIYNLPGVDAIFVGPNDLFWQMKAPDGTPPSPEEFDVVLDRILEAGREAGVPVGLHTQSVEDAKGRSEAGWQFIAVQSELKMMVTRAQEIVTGLGIAGQEDLARY